MTFSSNQRTVLAASKVISKVRVREDNSLVVKEISHQTVKVEMVQETVTIVSKVREAQSTAKTVPSMVIGGMSLAQAVVDTKACPKRTLQSGSSES